MANPEHLAKLKEGVEAWDAWRKANPEIKPDLRQSELRSLNLAAVNLTCTNLSNANLSGTDLYLADLSGAKLFRTGLDRTNLTCVTVSNADFTEAQIWETVIADVNLSQAIGLDDCIQQGPSVIDHRTLIKSGPLPLKFLRGCGLPDQLIEYIPSILSDSPIQFYSCFISYASKDDEFARRLHADLQDYGVRCWFAPEDMKIGDRIGPRIDEQIRMRDKLLLILSETSVESAWVTKEVRTALTEEEKHDKTVLFPVRLDDAVMDSTEQWAHDIQRTRHIGDFTSWKDHDSYKKAFDRLLRDLKVEGDG